MRYGRERFVGVALAVLGLMLPLAGEEGRPTITLEKTRGDVHEVRGSFVVNATTAVVRDVITDYDNLTSFVPGLRKSHVVESDPPRFVLEQVGVASAFFFRKKVFLRLMVLEREDGLDFEDVEKRNFRDYRGGWSWAPTPEGAIRADYWLSAVPDFYAPNGLTDRSLSFTALDLLTRVKAEIIRRQEATVPISPAGD